MDREDLIIERNEIMERMTGMSNPIKIRYCKKRIKEINKILNEK